MAKLQALRNAPTHIIPMTLLRAEAILAHPATKNDHVILIVIWKDEQMVGFLGSLPESLTNGPMAWLCTIWVDEKHRGQKLAETMVETMKSAWHQRLGATGFIPGLDKLYKGKCGFTSGQTLIGRRFYLYENLASLAKHRHIPMGFTLNTYPQWPKFKKIHTEPFSMEHIEIQRAIGLRDAESWNWWINHAFVSEVDDYPHQAERYPFSRMSGDFKKEMFGAIFCTQRQNKAVVSAVINEIQIPESVNLLLSHARKEKWDSITAFHPQVIQSIQKQISPFVIHKAMQREFLWHPWLNDEIKHVKLQASDGDWGLAWG